MIYKLTMLIYISFTHLMQFHARYNPTEEQISTLDLFDKHFVLLAGNKGEDWCEAARDVAARLGLSLDAYRVGEAGADLVDVDGHWAAAYGVQPTGAVIVRPDGFVGWRTQGAESPSLQNIEAVMRRLLGRSE